MVDKRRIFSAVIHVGNSDGSISSTSAAGDMHSDSRYFIASVTKLYITAVVLSLEGEGRISLKAKFQSTFRLTTWIGPIF